MRTQVVDVRCDLCGYGGPWTRPESFEQRGGVDLCRWCAHDPAPLRAMECGRHLISFHSDWSWSCSCGERWVPWMCVALPDGSTVSERVIPVGRARAVLDAVPNLRYALARIHSEEL